VKELLKSVQICQSYRKNKTGTFFYGPRCMFSCRRSSRQSHNSTVLCTTCVTRKTRSSATAEKQRVTCPHGGRGLGPPAHSPFAPSGYAYGRIRKPQRTYVKRAVHKAHFKMNRAFKVIQGHPYWCRYESRTVCCRNVQLMPTLFLKPTKIRQRENGKFVVSTTSRRFEDVPARNAFEYLQIVYIARN